MSTYSWRGLRTHLACVRYIHSEFPIRVCVQDALKKGQQLLKWGAEQAIFDGTPAPTSNPMIAIFQESGTLDKLQASTLQGIKGGCMHAATYTHLV